MTPVPMSNLRAEYAALKSEIDSAIARVIDSGRFTLTPEVAAFEAEFAAYCGSRYAVGVGSGTAALHLALLACGIGPGDEVITVPNTDLPTTTTISHCGATFAWVDVDPRTFNLDPQRLEDAITPRTRAILPVHLFGYPAPMDAILDIARRHDLVVIEDATLAAGAEIDGHRVGTFGDAGCFSFAPEKVLGAYGDAGLVTTDRPDVAERLRVLRNYGQDIQMEGQLGGLAGIANWRMVAEGFNERLDALQAAVLRAKLPTLDDRIAARRRAACRYDELLADLDLVIPYEAPNVKSAYRAYAIQVADRARVRDHLTARGIASRIYYMPPLHLQPVYAHLGYGPGAFPVAERLADHTLGIPVFPEITDTQIETVVAALRECVPPRSR